MLRLILAIVAAVNFYAAYVFFFTPEAISGLYALPVDDLHTFFAMTIGALVSVFGLGALMAFFRPLKYGAIIIMLLLMHFTVFLIDVIVLARGQMLWQVIVPEMVYFLIVSTALVRWYPTESQESQDRKEKKETQERKKQEIPANANSSAESLVEEKEEKDTKEASAVARVTSNKNEAHGEE